MTLSTGRAISSLQPPRRRVALGSLLIAAVVSLACAGGEKGQDTARAPAVPAVEALQARQGVLPSEERLHGTVRARNQVLVRPEITAPIAAVLVESGEEVERGQALVRLADVELSERLRQAEAAHRLARAQEAEAHADQARAAAEAERYRQLAAESIVSLTDLDAQEAALAAAQARTRQSAARVSQAASTIQERRNALARTVVRAPVPGRVGKRDAEVGLLATPSTVLFIVGDPRDLVVEVALTEETLARVRQGSRVGVRPRGADAETVGGTLARISPFLRPQSFSTAAEVDLDEHGGLLWPGMFVTVDLLHPHQGLRTLIPAAVAWEDPGSGKLSAWVVTDRELLTADGRELLRDPLPVSRREIRLVGEGGGVLAVEGVEPGEWVVTIGQHLLDAAQTDGGETEEVSVSARVRPVDWDRVLQLQGLKREDLLRRFLEKQVRLSRWLGAGIPPDPATVDELLRPPEKDGPELGATDGSGGGGL